VAELYITVKARNVTMRSPEGKLFEWLSRKDPRANLSPAGATVPEVVTLKSVREKCYTPRMECSICKSAEAAAVINELLEKKTGLDSIAEQTGFHRSSIHRHHKKCFVAWRAARLKAKSGKTDGTGRLVALWPELSLRANLDPEIVAAYYSHYGLAISASDLRADDDVLVIRYTPPVPLRAEAKIDGIPEDGPADQSAPA